jgi:hypothetical protein
VGGLISRDPLVGPLAGACQRCRRVRLADHHGHPGEAMAMGERSPVAVLDARASGRPAASRGGHGHQPSGCRGRLACRHAPVGQPDARLRGAGGGCGALSDHQGDGPLAVSRAGDCGRGRQGLGLYEDHLVGGDNPQFGGPGWPRSRSASSCRSGPRSFSSSWRRTACRRSTLRRRGGRPR